jgi:hypothetical protein
VSGRCVEKNLEMWLGYMVPSAGIRGLWGKVHGTRVICSSSEVTPGLEERDSVICVKLRVGNGVIMRK